MSGDLIRMTPGGSMEAVNESGQWSHVPKAAAAELFEARRILREIISQLDQGGEDGKVFARDDCISQARAAIA